LRPLTIFFSFFLFVTATLRSNETEVNRWQKISENEVGPGFSPGIIWSQELKKFIYFCGSISHSFKGERPYDVMSLDPIDKKWKNELPKGAENRGGETGFVKDVSFKTPYYGFGDSEGLLIPNRRHTCMWYQYTYAPWDSKMYALICGRMLTYEPKERIWQDTKAPAGPMPYSDSHRSSLSWSALCADPVNKEILLFGGCGVLTPDGSPGTWVFSTEKNEWRKLTGSEGFIEPPPRALSPMVYDPTSKKIMLFGGDRLDQLYADTWVYDCATRTWEEKKPAISPAPRFGHSLLYLPKSNKIVLLGGKGYTSSTSYQAVLYKALPFQAWVYDMAKNEWQLIQYLEKGGPAESAFVAATAASSDADEVIWVGPGTEKGSAHSVWAATIDATKVNPEETAKIGVTPGTLEFRTKSYDPEWYTKDLPKTETDSAEDVLKKLVVNTWIPLKCPRWPENRMGGGWSTVTLDTINDQLLHMGGGHSSYFGNDMAHYDIKSGLWSIACRPQFALEYNYDLNGPGLWGFNGAPWGNHNYHAYAYDPTLKRVIYLKGTMHLQFDPITRTWPFEEKFTNNAFVMSKYINYLVTTPQGVICWTQTKENPSVYKLWRLEDGKAWKEIKTTGEPLPIAICDASTITYDSKRDRLLFTTTIAKNSDQGQVWSADLKTNEVKKLNPTGMEFIVSKRFARESVYLPKDDLVMLGFLLQQESNLVVPIYDCENNSWLGATMKSADFFNNGKPGSTVDLGLVYDPKRDLVFATLCNLRPGSLFVLKSDKTTLNAIPLK